MRMSVNITSNRETRAWLNVFPSKGKICDMKDTNNRIVNVAINTYKIG